MFIGVRGSISISVSSTFQKIFCHPFKSPPTESQQQYQTRTPALVHTVSNDAPLQSSTTDFLPGGRSPVCRRCTKCSMSLWTSHSSSDFLTSSYSYGKNVQESNSATTRKRRTEASCVMKFSGASPRRWSHTAGTAG